MQRAKRHRSEWSSIAACRAAMQPAQRHRSEWSGNAVCGTTTQCAGRHRSQRSDNAEHADATGVLLRSGRPRSRKLTGVLLVLGGAVGWRAR
jgi:hypothetical protein